MDKIKFTPKDILQKHFEHKVRGYNSSEVDKFLDGIIEDYETFNKQIQQLQNENDRLKNQINDLKTNGTQVSSHSSASQNYNNVNNTNVNVDILKRLSNLERRVFGSQLGDNNPNSSHRL
ncbi:cell cycle protein GpsB [Philodulcilactobacillus myokoensis]|uniref:Cell cycle protein GpsB n=1 Tax=Philodulcilactobacillus myokoensis TaxID=2929573 RepID=A0A9W6B0T0_9LACO|nr:cell division regulator GpsB [Philodulcilactobacillus myokoensis]GLB46847.1 cell cycle protein GpsB [Philodulcilactobacillus myokoensis]